MPGHLTIKLGNNNSIDLDSALKKIIRKYVEEIQYDGMEIYKDDLLAILSDSCEDIVDCFVLENEVLDC